MHLLQALRQSGTEVKVHDAISQPFPAKQLASRGCLSKSYQTTIYYHIIAQKIPLSNFP
jgi:hypothetical protein